MNQWVDHKCDECPVLDDVVVTVQFRSGRVATGKGKQIDWEQLGPTVSSDVVKYKLGEK